jgi:phosphatidylserine decarboxylase
MLSYYALSLALPVILMLPLSIKWQIQQIYAIPWLLLMGAVSCLTTWIIGTLFPAEYGILVTLPGLILAVSFTIIILLVCFFRDPERLAPAEEGVLVSPADGKVIYVKNIEDGEFPHL